MKSLVSSGGVEGHAAEQDSEADSLRYFDGVIAFLNIGSRYQARPAVDRALLVLGIVLMGLLCSCDGPHQRCDRFEDIPNLNPALYHVRDRQTGKEYLVGIRGGIIEVEPTRIEAK